MTKTELMTLIDAASDYADDLLEEAIPCAEKYDEDITDMEARAVAIGQALWAAYDLYETLD